MDRRDFLTLSIKAAMAAGFTAAIPTSLLRSHTAHAAVASAGLSDPASQPIFRHSAANAMSTGFKYSPKNNQLKINMAQTVQMTGLVGVDGVTPVPTTVWGYGDKNNVSWPGPTIERHVNDAPLVVKWRNNLIDGKTGMPLPHLLPVDTSFHWCYSLPGYTGYSIEKNGVPLVPHVHGGRNDSRFDGNPEYFFSPGNAIQGPRYVSSKYVYGGPNWNDTAGMLWYHDHALGITRLNVYAGLAGFFALRDDNDTGAPNNPLGLPADPYELGYAVQDRMFRNNGELFWPAFPGEPFYDDFITEEGATLPANVFPNGGPTGLAEFFGDHMVVNGVIWPKVSVEPRQYRVRLLNGTDSRFMRLKLKIINGGAGNSSATDPALGYELPFYVIGSDQGLRYDAKQLTEIDFMPGERLDLVIDFKDVPAQSRVIIENILGDAPFGGEIPDADDFFPDRRTDRVMAFDVELPFDNTRPDTSIGTGSYLGGQKVVSDGVTHIRKLALYEGKDEYGRLQPMLGTAEPVTDVTGNIVNGSLPWHAPITENPGVGDTEIWEIYNATGDAHPIHVHLVHFEMLNRQSFVADVIKQSTHQHNGTQGIGFRLENINIQGTARDIDPAESTRRDMVMALPGEVTRIKMTFGKPGRYVWHCHILSHEDHDMMRPFHVGPGPY